MNKTAQSSIEQEAKLAMVMKKARTIGLRVGSVVFVVACVISFGSSGPALGGPIVVVSVNLAFSLIIGFFASIISASKYEVKYGLRPRTLSSQPVQHINDPYLHESRPFTGVNPANGLPTVDGVDSAGFPFGTTSRSIL